MRLITALAVTALAAASLASGAGAGQPSRLAIHDEFAFEAEDFCDVPGLTVAISGVLDVTGALILCAAVAAIGVVLFVRVHGAREGRVTTETTVVRLAPAR